jgi:hypothetical protein
MPAPDRCTSQNVAPRCLRFAALFFAGKLRHSNANKKRAIVQGRTNLETHSVSVIYAALAKTKGKADGDALVGAAKAMKWQSPRRPMSIDPATRDVVQTVYIRKVEKVGGKLVNVVVDKVPEVKDPFKAAMKK